MPSRTRDPRFAQMTIAYTPPPHAARRNRRTAQRRQVHPLQRPDAHAQGGGGELPVLHDRAQRRRRHRARRAPRAAREDLEVGEDRPGHDRVRGHRRPRQGRVAGRGPRQQVPPAHPRGGRDRRGRPLLRGQGRRPRRRARSTRSPTSRRSRPSSSSPTSRPWRARGRSSRRTPAAATRTRRRRSRSPRSSLAHLEPGQARPHRCRSRRRRSAVARRLFLLTCKPMLFACNVAEGDLATAESASPHVAAVRDYAKTHARHRGRRRLGGDRGGARRAARRGGARVPRAPRRRGLRRLLAHPRGLSPARPAHVPDGRREGDPRLDDPRRRHRAAGRRRHPLGLRAGLHQGGDRLLRRPRRRGLDGRRREKGLVRQEGKDYVVQDGDVILFKFNV